MSRKLEHLIPFSGYQGQTEAAVLPRLDDLLQMFALDGTEVYIAHVVPRDQSLFADSQQKQALVDQLTQWKARRLHCSYWAEPSDFLARIDYPGLVTRFGGEKGVIDYFGDTTGEKMYDRWCQEYELAKTAGIPAVTFHLIDYFHIDGLWEFTISRKDVLSAMVVMTQRLLDELEKRNLLNRESPLIELENAGWGLEYGVQSAQDYQYVFDQVKDPSGRLRIAWDINHLLHAIGFDEGTNRARFFLTEGEITPDMHELEDSFGVNPTEFAHQWVAQNVLDERLLSKVSAIHLSDNTLKRDEFFRNGQLTGKRLGEIQALETDGQREDYGVKIVLGHYDSHEPLGVTLKRFPEVLDALLTHIPTLSVLHELKNNELDVDALKTQLRALGYDKSD